MRKRIVQGKLKIITGEDHNIVAREGNIVNVASAQLVQVGNQNGVSYGTYSPPPPRQILKKFLVHFRRPSDYDGKYGFDWLRDEYIYPIETVTNDNNGNPIGAPTPLCKDVNALKTEYRVTDVTNPISPYGKDYFPAWLSIFPHTTTAQFAHGSTMHKNGVDLDLEIEELEALSSDATELIFESSNSFLTVSPQKINLSSLLGNKQTKQLGSGATRDYYLHSKKINIKCSRGALTNHEEIKVFAKLKNQKVEVGKLMVFKNDVIPKAEIVVVNVITGSGSANLRSDYQYLFKNQSFNQALIRAEVTVDTSFDLLALKHNSDVSSFLTNMNNMSSGQILDSLVEFYEKYGDHRPTSNSGQINYATATGTTRTYLFYTELTAGNVLGMCSLDANLNWGNSYVIYQSGLLDDHTIVHEGGHSYGLPHVFQEGSFAGPHTFYHGYTDNYMDYKWQAGNIIIKIVKGKKVKRLGSSGPNVYKGKMFSFFKWQWKILRNDRSLIFNY